MIVAIIVISIVLFLSIIINGIFINVIKKMDMLLDEKEEVDYFNNKIEIKDKNIKNKFEDVTVYCYIAKIKDASILAAVDISNYMKNNIIRLTSFVQEQEFNQLAQELEEGAILKQLCANLHIEPEDEEDIELLKEVIKDSYSVNRELGIISRAPFYHCTVLQLKDGRWVWQPGPEEGEDEI